MAVFPSVKVMLVTGIIFGLMHALGERPEGWPGPAQLAQITPLAKAQGAGPGKFVSATKFFSLTVPARWRTEEKVPGVALIMASSQAALDRFKGGAAFQPGDVVVNVGFLPFALLRLPGVRDLDFKFEAPPEVFLQSLLPMFHLSGDALGDISRVSLGNGRTAGMLRVSSKGHEGLVLLVKAGEGIIALISTVYLPGEAQRFQASVYTVAGSVDFVGTQEGLLGSIIGR